MFSKVLAGVPAVVLFAAAFIFSGQAAAHSVLATSANICLPTSPTSGLPKLKEADGHIINVSDTGKNLVLKCPLPADILDNEAYVLVRAANLTDSAGSITCKVKTMDMADNVITTEARTIGLGPLESNSLEFRRVRKSAQPHRWVLACVLPYQFSLGMIYVETVYALP